MELAQLEDLVNKARTNEEKTRTLKQQTEQEKIRQYELIMERQWNEKVVEWIKNLRYLEQRGYKFITQNHAFCMCSECRPPQEFIGLYTDGVNHNFGLYPDGTMGAEQGGACGMWDVHTDGSKWWMEHHSTKERRPMTSQWYEDILRRYKDSPSRIAVFEQRYNNLIEYIKKQAEGAK